MSGYYPYLLCGLPDIHFEMDPESFSYEEIYRQIFELLTPSDRKLAELFLAFPTHAERVRRFLACQDEDAVADFLGEDLPRYQKAFFSHSLSFLLTGEEDALVEMSHEAMEMRLVRLLDEAFYRTVTASGNVFLRKWFDFDLVLKNTLVAFAARKQKRSPEGEFLYPGISAGAGEDGEPELVVWLKENMEQGDFGIKLRLAYAEEMFSALDLPDVFERERAVDRFRWNMAEEMVRGKDFQIGKVLCYLLKAGILLRWQKMQAEEGRRYLQDVVAGMRKVNLQGAEL